MLLTPYQNPTSCVPYTSGLRGLRLRGVGLGVENVHLPLKRRLQTLCHTSDLFSILAELKGKPWGYTYIYKERERERERERAREIHIYIYM